MRVTARHDRAAPPNELTIPRQVPQLPWFRWGEQGEAAKTPGKRQWCYCLCGSTETGHT